MRGQLGAVFYIKGTDSPFTSHFIKSNYVHNHKSLVFAVKVFALSELVSCVLLLCWTEYISLVSRPRLRPNYGSRSAFHFARCTNPICMSLILDDVSALGGGCDGEEPVCQVQVMFESRPQGLETALLLRAADRCGAGLHRPLQAPLH